MCTEWLIFKYYYSCGRAQNGGPYHSHPTRCFKPCEREGNGCKSVVEVGPPSGKIRWLDGYCRRCETSAGKGSWWNHEGHGEGAAVPDSPPVQEVFKVERAPSYPKSYQSSGSVRRLQQVPRPRRSSVYSTESEVNRKTYDPRNDPAVKMPEGEFDFEDLRSTVGLMKYPLRTSAWINDQRDRVRGSRARAYKPPYEAKTPVSSVHTGSPATTILDSVSVSSGIYTPYLES